MSVQLPENWVVIKYDVEDKVEYKVFGGWRGGYLGSDSCRLNSGITKVEDHDDHYRFYGYSGSVYWCYKHNYGIRGLHNNSVLHNIIESGKTVNAELLSKDTDFTALIIDTDLQQ
jgi:hypothetical protein